MSDKNARLNLMSVYEAGFFFAGHQFFYILLLQPFCHEKYQHSSFNSLFIV